MISIFKNKENGFGLKVNNKEVDLYDPDEGIKMWDNFVYLELINEDKVSSEIYEGIKKSKINTLITNTEIGGYRLLIPFKFGIENPIVFSSFSFLEIIFDNNKPFVRTFTNSLENKSDFWKLKWSPEFCYEKFYEIAKTDKLLRVKKIGSIESNDLDLIDIKMSCDSSKSIEKNVNIFYNKIKGIANKIISELYSFGWDKIYETNEEKFSKQVILPLLRRMQFFNIKYVHGINEYGKDIIFSEINKFGEQINYGIQVKAGDVSGKSNNKIEELINQAKIAIKTPFQKVGNNNDFYISVIVIAISGKFTTQAKQRIINEIPSEFRGSIFFWDKEKILELLERYPNKNG